jgi:hypothetical protein
MTSKGLQPDEIALAYFDDWADYRSDLRRLCSVREPDFAGGTYRSGDSSSIGFRGGCWLAVAAKAGQVEL